jgi:hypothetical protein
MKLKTGNRENLKNKKNWHFKKISKTDKHLANLMKKKRNT